MRQIHGLAALNSLLLLLTGCTGRPSSLEIHCKEGERMETVRQLRQASFPIRIQDGSFNPGYTRSFWWLKTTVSNDTDRPLTRYILLNNPHINRIQVMDTTHDRGSVLGDKLPYRERPVDFSDFAIPVPLNPHERRTVFIGVDKSGESLQLKAEVTDGNGLMRLGHLKALGAGLTTGWMMLVVFIVMLTWLFSRESAHLNYSAYILFITLWILANHGIGFQVLWPDSPDFNNISRPFFLLLSLFFFARALLQYFGQDTGNRTLRRWIHFESWLALSIIPALVFNDFESLNPDIKSGFLMLMPILVAVFVIASSLYIYSNWRAEVRFSGFYFFGVLFFLLISVCQIAFQFGIGGSAMEFINMYGAGISLVGETSIIATGFIYRFNESEREKKDIRAEFLARQYALSKEVIDIQEMERRRIGRDIHDSIGGMLAAMRLYLEKSAKESTVAYLGKCRGILNQTIREIKTIIDNLVPQNIHMHGFCKAFELTVANHIQTGKARILFYHNVNTELSISCQTVLYRILTEILSNCERHSRATELNISIIEDERDIRILFEDNGTGFDPLHISEGHGLRNIRNRVEFLHGDIHIDSSGQGTTVIIQVPVEPHRAQTNGHEEIDRTH